MDNIKEKLKKEEYRNWVKSTLGLEQTKKAIQEYVMEKFHNYVHGKCKLKEHQQSFTQDELNHLLLGGSLRTNLKSSIQYKLDKKNTTKIWVWNPSDTCSGSYRCKSSFEKIASLHRSYRPGIGLSHEHVHWQNSDFSLNVSLEWAIAKMFMPSGHEKTKHAEDIDSAAMFHLMIVCDLFSSSIEDEHLFEDWKECGEPLKRSNTRNVKLFKDRFSQLMDSYEDAYFCLIQLKKARNALFHSSDNIVNDSEVNKYFGHMEGLLNGASNDSDIRQDVRDRIKADVVKITKLKSSEITVSMFDDALKVKRKQIHNEFEKTLCENDPNQLRELFKLAEKTVEDMQEINKHADYIKELKNIQKGSHVEGFLVVVVITVSFAIILRICLWWGL